MHGSPSYAHPRTADMEGPLPGLLKRNLNTSSNNSNANFLIEINVPQKTDTPHRSADPTSIIIVDEAPKEAGNASFFSFNSPGGFTWWAGVILGVFSCCTVASIIIILVESSRRELPTVLTLMSAQQCPFLSPLLPPLAFDAWRATCSRVTKGSTYRCTTSSDCVALGSPCADPRLLALLQCASTGGGAGKSEMVCAYPSFNSASMPPSPSALSSSGFCPQAGTTCALCLDDTCDSTTPLTGSIGCPPSSACTSNSWLCYPLSS
ncbi:hypothetical protein ABL78_3113 [Leptomonas seymouri]|uniref:Uncharacterized protein n=1 Tax=Leptomonas seymouri TaxID=5684 RepID=A0A0N1I8B4_LEPSE|nr:hypothetical protein ABL78_3113 [Leptomonas seymouri]|eukprot:KPI87814.1 hypothetical protein ABL78_3113 [Leptomonas seymouri]